MLFPKCLLKRHIVVFVCALCSLLFASLRPERALATPIPNDIKKIVTFIFAPVNGQLKAIGTGFFVSVPDEANPNRSFLYTVTAKHVLLIDSENPAKGYHPIIFVRVNKNSEGSDLVPIFLTGPKAAPVFTYQNDPAVDVVVVAGAPRGSYDFKTLPVSLLATKEHLSKGEIKDGDEAFFVGLFSPFPGIKKNYPVVRFGRVAMVPDEKIPWDGKLLDLYLMETQSFGGNSGSPVFFHPGLEREPGKIVLGRPTLLLAGVMMGTFRNSNPVLFIEPGKRAKPEQLDGKVPISVENMGIAAVVPAYQQREVLFSDEVQAHRRAKTPGEGS